MTEPDSKTASVTLSGRVYNTLYQDIVEGRLRPGQRLVRRTLSRELGVSPIPITEALLRLEHDGLVDSHPMRGSRVCCPSLEKFQEDRVLREALECQAARLCVQNASDRQLAQLRAKARATDRVLSQGNPYSRLGVKMDAEFHLQIAELSGVGSLTRELKRLWSRRFMEVQWAKIELQGAPASWHEQIVDVFETRDLQAAEDKLREHVCFGKDTDEKAIARLVE